MLDQFSAGNEPANVGCNRRGNAVRVENKKEKTREKNSSRKTTEYKLASYEEL